MVRVGGLRYTIDPTQSIGNRITDMALNGESIDPNKTYKVAGWASVQPQSDDLPDIWDVVSEYLRDIKTVKIDQANVPVIKGVEGNPGLARN